MWKQKKSRNQSQSQKHRVAEVDWAETESVSTPGEKAPTGVSMVD